MFFYCNRRFTKFSWWRRRQWWFLCLVRATTWSWSSVLAYVSQCNVTKVTKLSSNPYLRGSSYLLLYLKAYTDFQIGYESNSCHDALAGCSRCTISLFLSAEAAFKVVLDLDGCVLHLLVVSPSWPDVRLAARLESVILAWVCEWQWITYGTKYE